jgi:hypothetical protein
MSSVVFDFSPKSVFNFVLSREGANEVKNLNLANPKYLAVHFHPDGHTEASLSENGTPSPRLKLERRLSFLLQSVEKQCLITREFVMMPVCARRAR